MTITPQGRRFVLELLEAERDNRRSLPAEFVHPATREALVGHGLIEWTWGSRLKLTAAGREAAESAEGVRS